MRTKVSFVLLSLLCVVNCVLVNGVNAQSETHNFITYDTTVNLVGGPWNLRITRPANMFTAGHPDTASRPAIIFMVGSGEITNPAYIASYGPHYWLNNGWNGGIQLANGTHYPIIISVQPYTIGPTSRSTGNLLLHILNTYHIKANAVHLTGLSMGAIRWEMILSAERTAGGEDYMKRITSIAALSGTYDLNGQPDWVRGDIPERDLLISPAWKGAKTWVKKYKGKYLALEGASDGTQSYLWMGTQPMNDTMPGSAYFSYYPSGHCCWNTMYDPGMTNWNCIGPQPLGSFITTGYAPNTIGTYKPGDNLFKWMLKQGDTTLVGSATPANQAPVANAGASQTITLPASSLTLTGSGSDPDGTIASYKWTQLSGTAATITSSALASTTITGLTTAGVRVFRLTVMDNLGAAATSDVTVTVNAVNQPPVANAGATQTILLPITSVTLTGSGADPDGTIVSYAWSQVSGTVAVIASPLTAATNILGLSLTGTRVFRLTVTDNQGATATSDITVTVNIQLPLLPNQSPVSNAGSGQTIVLPASAVTLSGSGTDADGTVASYAWSQVSGTAAAIASPATASTNVTAMSTSGTRVFRLTVTDNAGASAYADVTVNVDATSGGSSVQSETHDFITEDSTVDFPGVGTWNYRISRPRNMFTPGHPDTASRPVIIFMVGVGEACNCPAALGYNGPHAIYNPNGGGWDGGLKLGNGTHYPIYISVQPHAQWPSTKSSRMLIEFLLNRYHIKRNSVHLTGLSMGAMTWTRMINSEVSSGDQTSMKLVKSIAALQGQGNAYYAWRRDANNSAPTYQLGGDSVVTPERYQDMYTEPLGSAPNPRSLAWKAYKIWAKKYGGRYFSLNGTADYAGVDNWLISEAMNDTLPNSGYFAWENIGGGQHCCWNNMYDPNATNWTSVGTLGPGIVASGYTPHVNTMGNYHPGDNIFTWMIKQGDTSLVGTASASPLANLPPTANAGLLQTIILPASSVTLDGSGTAGSGGAITSHTWAKLSGASAIITDPTNYSSTVTGLSSGIYVFRLTVLQNDNQTATSDVTIVVKPASSGTKTIPGRIEAESFDAKSGAQYAVTTADAGGGQQVIGIGNGSWMDYNVNVTQSGNYSINFRIATPQANAQFQVKSGNTLLGTMTFPSTGGWDIWSTATLDNIPLTSGSQTIRILSTSNNTCNFNWMDWGMTTALIQPPSAGAGSAQTVILPVSQVVLSGTGTANNGGSIASHVWTKFSGGTATIADPSNYNTTITGLSAGTYVFQLTVTQNDNQMATADVTVTVNPAASNGKTIPGKIEAESFDAKNGGMYAVATTDAGDGQQVIGIANGNWMDYNVMVGQTGVYTVNFRVATSQNNAQFQVKSGGTILGTINIPNTGGWNNWVNVPLTNIPLTAGMQTIRIISSGNESCNFNWMDWTVNTSAPDGKTIAGKIEAENFDAKSGAQYAVPSADAGAGQQVIGISNGSWMDYNVTVTQSGIYNVNFRVATSQSNAQFQIKSGNTVLATVAIPNTGGWNNWVSVPVSNVLLSAGVQTIRIISTANETCNFNWMDWVLSSQPVTVNSMAEPIMIESVNPGKPPVETSFKIFPNPVANQFVLQANNDFEGIIKIQVLDQSGHMIKQQQSTKNKGLLRIDMSANGLPPGSYLVRIQMGNQTSSLKMIKL